MTPVTDPELLRQLEAGGSEQPVTNPALIAMLEGKAAQRGRPNRAGRGPEAARKPPARDWKTVARAMNPAGWDFADATQHHVGNLAMGTGQLIHKGVTGLANMVLPAPEQTMSGLITGEAPKPQGGLQRLRQGINDIDQRAPSVLAKREADYQARTPTNAASLAGATVGEVAPWMVGIGELRALGLLPKITETGMKGAAQKGGLLALEGAAMGVPQPVTGDGSYAEQKALQVGVGAVAAPLTGGAMAALGKTAGAARYLTPSGREGIAQDRLGRMLGNDPATIAKLRATNGVPGFELTPAQAIGTPEAVQAERMLRNNGATAPAFASRESANNAAARGQVKSVAGDDAAMEAARNARTANSDAYRGKYLPESGSPMVDSQPLFATLERLSLSANPTIRGAAREHLSLLKRQAVDGKVPAYALDDIRQNAGAMIAKHTPIGGGGSAEAARYAPVTNQIADTLDRAVPGYRNYLASYARDSQPINDMQAGRALLSAIDSGGLDASGNQAVSLNAVKAMLAKDNRANFPMSPQARQQIEAVLEVLKKRSITNNTIAAAGPGSAADLQRAITASPLLMRILGHGGAAIGGTFGGLPGYAAGVGVVEGANALNNSVVRRVGQQGSSASAAAAALEASGLRLQKPQGGLSGLLLPYDQARLPPP